MAKSRLGNDPFQRGAAPKAEEPAKDEGAKDKDPAPGGKKKHKKHGRPQAVPPIAEVKASPEAVVAEPEPQIDEPLAQVGEPLNQVREPLNQVDERLNQVDKPLNQVDEPLNQVDEPLNQVREPLNQVDKPLNQAVEPLNPVGEAETPIADPPEAPAPLDAETVSTAEDAPFPSRPAGGTGRPRLRLLRFDRPELERTLADALETVERFTHTPGAAGEEVRRLVTDLSGRLGGAQARDAAQELLARVGEILASEHAVESPLVDDFGRDPAFEAKLLAILQPIYKLWFRVKVEGLENVPANGPVILVANHSGAVPWDMVMLKTALALEHPAHRTLRPLAENFSFHFPFVGTWMNRFGVVRACQENAEALLEGGEAVAVFPEGAKGLGKRFGQRYQLQRFGRGGVVKLAMRTGAPIVPVAIVGAEETYPLITRVTRPVAPLGIPWLPITPTFPLLGPVGLLPLPTKWTIEIGAPIRYEEGRDVDELTVERRTEDLRTELQQRLDRLVAKRRNIFF